MNAIDTMRTNIILFAAFLALASCGGEKTLEDKKAELDQLNVEMAKLQNKISLLQEELAAADPSLLEAKEEEGILVGVKTLEPEMFQHFFEVNGSIEAVEIANVSPEQGGQIKEITVKEGDQVSAGTVLAKLNTSVLASSVNELEEGIALAQTVYDRQARLWEQKVGSELQYLQAKNNLEALQKKRETLMAQMAMSTIKAPFNGVVDRIMQKAGELAAPGMPVLTLVNMGEMKVKADVSENYVQAVKAGAHVDIDFPAFGYQTTAPIKNVSNIINPANRSFSVEVRVTNSKGILKPNGVATLRIMDFEADASLVVPAIAISKDAKGDFVYVAANTEGKTVAQKRYIKIGRSSDGNTRILEGLAEGDKVIVNGYNEVANGDLVRIQG